MKIYSVSMNNGLNNMSAVATPIRTAVSFKGDLESGDSFKPETDAAQSKSSFSAAVTGLANLFIPKTAQIQKAAKVHYDNITDAKLDELLATMNMLDEQAANYRAQAGSELDYYNFSLGEDFDFGRVRNTLLPDGTAKFEYPVGADEDCDFNSVIHNPKTKKVLRIVAHDVSHDIQINIDFENQTLTLTKGLKKRQDGTIEIEQEYVKDMTKDGERTLNLDVTREKDKEFVKTCVFVKPKANEVEFEFDKDIIYGKKVSVRLGYTRLPNNNYDVVENAVTNFETGILTIDKMYCFENDTLLSYDEGTEETMTPTSEYTLKVSYVIDKNGKLRRNK